MNLQRIKHRLNKEAVTIMTQTTGYKNDEFHPNAKDMLCKFCEAFKKITKYPIHAWTSTEKVYPLEGFSDELKDNIGESPFDGCKKVPEEKNHIFYHKSYFPHNYYIYTIAVDLTKCRKRYRELITEIISSYFALLQPIFNIYIETYKVNALSLPDIRYYLDHLGKYYGALYLRPQNIKVVRSTGYKKLMELYRKWMSYFKNNEVFNFCLDGDCLVVLFRYTSEIRSITNFTSNSVEEIITKMTKEAANQDEEPIYDAYNFYDDRKLTLNLLSQLRLIISFHELNLNFRCHPKALKTNHFYPSDGDQENATITEKIANWYNKEKIQERESKKAKEIASKNIIVTV